MSTNELITIMKKHRENRFILGIDGLSRSGKTTFVANLKENMKQESIPFHIFHIDDHIVGVINATIPDLKNGMSIIICNGILSGFGRNFFESYKMKRD